LLTSAILNCAALVGAIGLLIFSILWPNMRFVVAAMILPVLAYANLDWARRANSEVQEICAKWSVHEAMKQCGSSPDEYRAQKGVDGYDELWLVAPGETDQAFQCMSNWSSRSGAVSIKIDESVYQRNRRINTK
jgi:hypothetical protein